MKINYQQLRTNLTEQLTPFFPGSALYVIVQQIIEEVKRSEVE